MKMTVSVKENGDIYINEKQKLISDLTQELLESILDNALSDEVEFAIEGSTPIASFFKTIQAGTGEGSDLRELKKKNDETLRNNAEKGEEFVSQTLANSPNNTDEE